MKKFEYAVVDTDEFKNESQLRFLSLEQYREIWSNTNKQT